MIELIVIWKLATGIGNIASQKGLKKLGYQIMAVILWLCGEIFGAILGGTVLGTNGSFWLNYLFALVGAAIGAGITFLVMYLLPNPATVSPNDTAFEQEITGVQKFGRSGCVPILVIVLAIFCVGLGFVGGVIKEMMSVFPQSHATNFIIGTEISDDGQVIQSNNDIPSSAETIFLSFDFVTVEGIEPPVTVDWIVNGQIIYSSLEYMSSKTVVQSISRTQLGLSEFPKGVYEISIHIEYAPIASTSFVVK